MARRRPPTFASLTYALRAATYALHHLARDGRVREAWMVWCLTRPGVGSQGLDPVALKAWRVLITSGGDRSALDAALDADRETMMATLAIFCRDVLGLRYAWLPPALLDCFRFWVDDIVEGRIDSGHERRVLAWSLSDDWREVVASGRQRDTCERDVTWWYRVRVKDPPDALEDISREDSPAAQGRRGERRRSTTPHKAIARVETALARLTLEQTAVLH